MKRLQIPAASVKGYDKIMKSHLTIADAIADGTADLAIGTERVSHQIDGIDFIPLLEERFDFVIKKDLMETDGVRQMLRIMNSTAFQREVAHISGNDYRDMGKIITEV